MKKRAFVITCRIEYPNNPEFSTSSYVMRITKSEKFARHLIQSAYDDGARNRTLRIGKASNAVWLNDDHNSCSIDCNLVGLVSRHTFEIHRELMSNIFNKKSWLND